MWINDFNDSGWCLGGENSAGEYLMFDPKLAKHQSIFPPFSSFFRSSSLWAKRSQACLSHLLWQEEDETNGIMRAFSCGSAMPPTSRNSQVDSVMPCIFLWLVFSCKIVQPSLGDEPQEMMTIVHMLSTAPTESMPRTKVQLLELVHG